MGSSTGGSQIFRTGPHWPWDPNSLPYNGDRVSFSGVKRPGRGVDHPPPAIAEVKERVELYLYYPSVPSWPVELYELLVTSTLAHLCNF